MGSFTDSMQALTGFLKKSDNFASVLNIITARGNLNKWVRHTANHNLVAGSWINADTTSAAFTGTLPETPTDGDEIRIKDIARNWGTYNYTVARHGSATYTIDGNADDMTCNIGGLEVTLVYNANADDWVVATMFATGGSGDLAMVLLGTQVASGASTVDITTNIDATYSRYKIVCNDLTVANNDQIIRARVYDDVTDAWRTSNVYEWAVHWINTGSAHSYGVGTSTDGIVLNSTYYIGNESDEFGALTLNLYDPSSTTKFTLIDSKMTHTASDVNSRGVVQTGVGKYTELGNVTGIRFYPSSGTISGTFKLYGIK